MSRNKQPRNHFFCERTRRYYPHGKYTQIFLYGQSICREVCDVHRWKDGSWRYSKEDPVNPAIAELREALEASCKKIEDQYESEI